MIRKVSVDISVNNLVYFSGGLVNGCAAMVLPLRGGYYFLAVRSARLVARESRASQETFPLHTLSTIIVATSTHKSPTLHPF